MKPISLLILFFVAALTASAVAAADPNFGPNVLVFDAQMPMDAIQQTIDTIYEQQRRNEFGPQRYAFVFKPGQYTLDIKVGYYTQVLGLGASPNDVVITGAVRSKSNNQRGSVLTNFWRGCENMTVIPTVEDKNVWAVSQAAPFRRMHIKGPLRLHDKGYASGGFIADSVIDGQTHSGPQQQFFTRNSKLGKWVGGVWNMFFLGVANPPADNWPNPPHTVIDKAPVIREKPFLTLDKNGNVGVFVPALRRDSSGITWADGPAAGRLVSLDRFHIANPQNDNAVSLNAALNQGKHLLLTPGIYHLEKAIQIERPDTVILGLGIATLVPDNGTAAICVSDVDGVIVAGLLLDAAPTESPTLLQIGPPDSSNGHAENPSSLHDIFCRVGGAGIGKASCSVTINSRHVIGDHFWLWRADHGSGVGWDLNTTQNGLIVNADDVTIYGLFVEHYHQYQTLWNGNNGRVYFYQCEIPYDPPSHDAWRHDDVDGYAAYKVADNVTAHQAWGLGVYCVFKAGPIICENAIETPSASAVKMRRLVAIRLSGQPGSGIRHIINGKGDSVITKQKATMDQFGGD